MYRADDDTKPLVIDLNPLRSVIIRVLSIKYLLFRKQNGEDRRGDDAANTKKAISEPGKSFGGLHGGFRTRRGAS